MGEQDKAGDTPLHAAVRGRHVRACVALVERGASLRAPNDQAPLIE